MKLIGELIVILFMTFMTLSCATTPAIDTEEIVAEFPPVLVVGSKFVYQVTNLSTGNMETYIWLVKERKEYDPNLYIPEQYAKRMKEKTKEKQLSYWIELIGVTEEKKEMRGNFIIYDMNLNLLAFIVNGKECISYNPLVPQFPWPLKIGKKWVKKYTTRNLSKGPDAPEPRCKDTVQVMGYEVIKVPAGIFKTFKIHKIGYEIGKGVRLEETYWYSPSVGMAVKREGQDYLGNKQLTELVEYHFPKK